MKNLKNLGKVLFNAEQKAINGGDIPGSGVFHCLKNGIYKGCSLTRQGCEVFGAGTIARKATFCL